ncbi:hypothetical protein H4219_000941 [Mycoemilia scoparia]|uniref:E3 ubiquitin ligase complex SCF subunit n=1 Tax=Mycoemilia scoparia TaxID=417184 RepID=A0A9W8A1X5_9FUNG|nr:hypothetical protein H4219_000941 [Mycoemilia scoparia]
MALKMSTVDNTAAPAKETTKRTIKLVSSDDKDFEVDIEIAQQSHLIKNMIGDIGELDEKIPLLNVTSEILEFIIQYCEHHRNDPVALRDYFQEAPKRCDDLEPWDENFMNKNAEKVIEILMAANYLDIKPLVELGCKTVANCIRGKTTQEIRQYFNITDDFTADQEAKIRRENEWAAEQ